MPLLLPIYLSYNVLKLATPFELEEKLLTFQKREKVISVTIKQIFALKGRIKDYE